jgi:hypothetical protein
MEGDADGLQWHHSYKDERMDGKHQDTSHVRSTFCVEKTTETTITADP